MFNKRIKTAFIACFLVSSMVPASGVHAKESSLLITAAADRKYQIQDLQVIIDDKDPDEYPSGHYIVTNASAPKENEIDSVLSGKYGPSTSPLPAGEYMLFAEGEKGTFITGTTRENVYVNAQESFSYNDIVILTEGQRVTLKNCKAVPINRVNNAELSTAGNGMFKIGMHIPSGGYTIVPDAGMTGTLTIYSSMPQDPLPEPIYISSSYGTRLNNGQYIKMENCHFESAPEALILQITDKETILKIQAQLNGIGYDCGTPDGVAGGKTAEAVSLFQEQHGLPVNGKIDRNFQIALDIESPFYTVQAELGPYLIDTNAYLERYNAAAEELRQTDSGALNALTEEQVHSGEFSQEEGVTTVLEINKAATQVKTCFFVTEKTAFDRSAVALLAVSLYAIDASLPSPEAARDFALRLLYDGSAFSPSLQYSILPYKEGYIIWIRLPEEAELSAP